MKPAGFSVAYGSARYNTAGQFVVHAQNATVAWSLMTFSSGFLPK
jgi:hypothetical protein